MENTFDNLPKRMPYRVPEGFFPQNEQAILASLPPAKGRLERLWPYLTAVAAALVLAVAAWQFTTVSRLDGVLYADGDYLTDEELALWDEFYEADVFLSYDTTE